MSCLCILEIIPLLVASFANMFFHSLGFLCYAKAYNLIRSHCLFSFLLPWETGPRKYWYNLHQRMFCLCSLLGVLWYHVLSLSAILSLFLCMVWGCVLTLLIYMQLYNFTSNTCWRDFSLNYLQFPLLMFYSFQGVKSFLAR